jgi:predicted PurR-regulated permease PerM
MRPIGSLARFRVPMTGPAVFPRAVSFAIVGSSLILVVGAIYYARDFILPLVLATLLCLTLLPTVRSLQRRGVPAWLSAVGLVILLMLALVGTALLLAEPVSNMVSQAPRVSSELKKKFSTLQMPLTQLKEAAQRAEELTDTTGTSVATKVVLAQPGILSWAASTLAGIGTTLAATLLFALFLLASGDLFLEKIIWAVPTLSDKKRSLHIVFDIADEIAHYFQTVTLINIALGVVVGIAMAALGMPNPLLWGVGAMFLNYIPYVGAIVGVLAAAAVSLISFPTLAGAAAPPIAYLLINLLESEIVTPMTLQRRLRLNAVVILIALAFAAWIWGIVGALIAVPLLVVLKVFCDHIPGLATLGAFLSGAPVPEPMAADASPEVAPANGQLRKAPLTTPAS